MFILDDLVEMVESDNGADPSVCITNWKTNYSIDIQRTVGGDICLFLHYGTSNIRVTRRKRGWFHMHLFLHRSLQSKVRVI